MIVTEEEAKTKRCQESFPAAEALSPQGNSEVSPMPVQTSYGAGAGFHMSYVRNTAPIFCLGSACMAWRPYGWRILNADGEYQHTQAGSSPRETPKLTDGYTSEAVGFCGKAGRH